MDLPISKDFQIPEGFSTDKFKIRILKVTDVVKDYDAEVYMWLRTSAFEKSLDPIFEKAIKEWISKEWPFKNVAYPGRDISWGEWEILK